MATTPSIMKGTEPRSVLEAFSMQGQVTLVTGGAGLLGIEHARAVAQVGATAILGDVDRLAAERRAAELRDADHEVASLELDVTDKSSCERALEAILKRYGRLDVLINNAARNPKVENGNLGSSRFENFGLDAWRADLEVGLTGAFLASQVFGSHMAQNGGGVILNIASDLGLIAPDQRIYRVPGLPEHEQPAKPPSYSATKGGLLMLSKYLATYWAKCNVRVNALVPGGVFAGQADDFVERLTNLIPMGRMACLDEYRAAVVFLCSSASSYMTGANLVIDGGRTCW